MAALHDTTLVVPADHPAFDGHFPGAPVLPGAVLVALVIDALPAGRLAPPHAVEQVKFLQPVRPGAQLRLRFTLDAARGVPFEVWQGAEGSGPVTSGGGLVAKGVLGSLAGAGGGPR